MESYGFVIEDRSNVITKCEEGANYRPWLDSGDFGYTGLTDTSNHITTGFSSNVKKTPRLGSFAPPMKRRSIDPRVRDSLFNLFQ